MAVASVQEFKVDPDDRTTTNYDAINDQLKAKGHLPPAGLILHTAGFTGEGTFRIFDVWETEQHWTRFRDEQLNPIVHELIIAAGVDAPPPREYTYELHDVVTG
jgi:uncharacterized protein YciU (UPF0263 family)